MSDVLLKVENLVKYFKTNAGKVKAVDGVSFEVYAGETLALVGESGCGKSTLGRLILRLIEPTNGKVLLEGEDLGKLSGGQLRKKRSELQIIFQDPFSSLDPHFTVGEIIAEPLRAMGIGKKEREARVLELLDQVGLAPETYFRYPHQFSGGQRQRIGIARALATSPKLIVCDEPVSALDVSIQAQILNLLKQLQKEHGLTYLFISHDLAVVRYISSRVCVMFLGQLCEICSTQEAYDHPLHPYTRMLIDSAPEPDPEFHREDRLLLQGEMPSPIHPPAGCRFCTRCPFATDECRQTPPEMKDYGGGHLCACHHPLLAE
ncbi:ABC transporter ATP-binding protein [Pseudoflavonifractor intestinihominis]|uniref:Oligopeptide/dipeptide ABC transporter ATP-binding protein n=1 Tax=Pseudoflavonifractor intestinihominis TaxID=3133171 RepID=A0ABV1ECR8_9FIRM|nr:oligopeptide/dipeptide ABC transporter ATP-binding protein [uncultured Pseudoflavonifractor sp.]